MADHTCKHTDECSDCRDLVARKDKEWAAISAALTRSCSEEVGRVITLRAQLAERDKEIEGLRRVGREMHRTLALLMPPVDDDAAGEGPDWQRVLDGSAPTADEESAKPATGEGQR